MISWFKKVFLKGFIPAVIFVCLTASTHANEQELFMVRSNIPYDIAMERVKSILNSYGYEVAHTQRCDGGLADFGYKTDFYRVLFWGKYQEVHELSAKFPEIVPFLPLKFLVFAENNETVFIALNPAMVANYYSAPEIKLQLMRWKNDIESIMNELRDYQYHPVSDS